MKIITYPNPLLQTRSQEINLVDFDVKKLRKLARKMIKLMNKHKGIGLAAPQAGESLRMCVINSKAGCLLKDLILINPIIIERSMEKNIKKEGCLSLPKVQIDVERPMWIKIKTIDFEGRSFNLETGDLLARVIQHEIDHLDGMLIIDHITYNI